LSGKGQSELKLSGNGNECKPLVVSRRSSHCSMQRIPRRSMSGCSVPCILTCFAFATMSDGWLTLCCGGKTGNAEDVGRLGGHEASWRGHFDNLARERETLLPRV
jgi:hypothetical protein